MGTSASIVGEFKDEDLIACRDAGVKCIELTLFGGGLDASESASLETLAERASRIQEHGLRLWSIHLPFGHRWDIATADADLHKTVLEKMERLLELGSKWGASVAVIHPSAEPIADDERRGFLKRSKSSLRHLGQVARQHGLRLAVECLPRTRLANTSDEMLKILAGLDDVGVCFDANHPLQERPEEFVAKLGERIITVHMSDYDAVDERHWLPGEGVIDWSAVIRELAGAGYGGPFMFEVGRKKGEHIRTPAELQACWQELLAAYLLQES